MMKQLWFVPFRGHSVLLHINHQYQHNINQPTSAPIYPTLVYWESIFTFLSCSTTTTSTCSTTSTMGWLAHTRSTATERGLDEKIAAEKWNGSTGTIARTSRRHPQAQQHPYSSSAFREGNRWMGGSVGCSVFEEHPRDRIEDESEA